MSLLRSVNATAQTPTPFSRPQGQFMQPQGHVQLLVSMVAGGLDPQAAIDAPRFCLEDGTSGGTLCLEDGCPVVEELRGLGHRPVKVGTLHGGTLR